jgi:hypothetical protein
MLNQTIKSLHVVEALVAEANFFIILPFKLKGRKEGLLILIDMVFNTFEFCIIYLAN